VSDTFTITTVAANTDPESFTLGSITNANINEVYSSNPVTISGINIVAAVSIS
jgi:hypothetical protein